ncbi:MAG: hypothetical protein HYZ81_05955 [Nitrospinae bacterium]|nr:hypothetical protein [Nitrospinota bacterium]
MLLCLLIASSTTWAGQPEYPRSRSSQGDDPCQRLLGLGATELRHILDFRLMRDFPISAQLDEGHARLSPLSISTIDCKHLRVVVSGAYEFRGNIGVMDVTRMGTLVILLRLTPQQERRQVFLEKPQVQDITFDNPAPWFDGKAVSNWAIALFATPTCARLQSGLPC